MADSTQATIAVAAPSFAKRKARALIGSESLAPNRPGNGAASMKKPLLIALLLYFGVVFAQDNACTQSVGYQRYTVQERIIQDVEMIDWAKSDLAREKKIGEISGAVSLGRLHNDGQAIVLREDDLEHAWHDYKALGGTANTPKGVGHELLNPCEVNPQAENWQSQIAAKIVRAWRRPPSAVPGIECMVYVTQVPGGEVTQVRIEQCNGDQAVRESIEEAVHRASPLPPPPDPALFDRNLRIDFKPN